MPDFDYRQKAWSAGLIVLFFVAWELFCLITGMSDLVLPRPSQVFVTLFEKFPILWPHILQTLATTMIGFLLLGVGLGVVLGAVIGVSKTAYDTAYPLLVGFSSISKVAVVPIFVLWFVSLGAGGADRALDLFLSDRGQYCDGPRYHRTRTRRRAEGARRQQARHSLECRASADHAILLCVIEGRDLLRLRRRGALRDRRVEPRHRHT